MLILSGVLGVIGVFLLTISVVIGLFVLVAAEAFFLMAYRTFARRSSPARLPSDQRIGCSLFSVHLLAAGWFGLTATNVPRKVAVSQALLLGDFPEG